MLSYIRVLARFLSLDDDSSLSSKIIYKNEYVRDYTIMYLQHILYSEYIKITNTTIIQIQMNIIFVNESS